MSRSSLWDASEEINRRRLITARRNVRVFGYVGRGEAGSSSDWTPVDMTTPQSLRPSGALEDWSMSSSKSTWDRGVLALYSDGVTPSGCAIEGQDGDRRTFVTQSTRLLRSEVDETLTPASPAISRLLP